jgi:hypothetical protein
VTGTHSCRPATGCRALLPVLARTGPGMPFGTYRDGGPATHAPGVYGRRTPPRQAPHPGPPACADLAAAAGFLAAVRQALGECHAHLVAPDGGPPAAADDATRYGWRAGAGEYPRPCGPCIGIAGPPGAGQRATLDPLAAYEAARITAAKVPGRQLAITFPQADAMLRGSGLVESREIGRGTGESARRVWELPVRILLGDPA